MASEYELQINWKKCQLLKKPVLQLYRKRDTELHTDASKDGFRGILLQKHDADKKFYPVFYFSRKTNPTQGKYHSYELGMLAVIEALKKLAR